jgi:hypothetical protein
MVHCDITAGLRDNHHDIQQPHRIHEYSFSWNKQIKNGGCRVCSRLMHLCTLEVWSYLYRWGIQIISIWNQEPWHEYKSQFVWRLIWAWARLRTGKYFLKIHCRNLLHNLLSHWHAFLSTFIKNSAKKSPQKSQMVQISTNTVLDQFIIAVRHLILYSGSKLTEGPVQYIRSYVKSLGA